MITDRHPQYTETLYDWSLMNDAYRGERKVKSKGAVYLPPTEAHRADGYPKPDTAGFHAYQSYKMRARFPNFVREAIQMALGMMHSQPPEIKLPSRMEEIRSSRGETMAQLLVRINEEQLLRGRVGIMADLPSKRIPGQVLPYITTYTADRIVNWDDGRRDVLIPQSLNLVVLDESEYSRTSDFGWEYKNKYRVLTIGNTQENEVSAEYRQGTFEDDNSFNESMMKSPNIMGSTLDKIPFVFINSVDINPDVDDPPLLDLANACLTIYRGDADYRQNLYMQAQDTFVTVGGSFDDDDTVRIGAGARIDLPEKGQAYFVGVSGSGLAEQRESLESLERRASSMGAQTMDTTSRERESGDSLRIRVAARTADLNQIADAGALGLESQLKMIAEWIGEDPEEVQVKPNKEFGEAPLTGQTMVEIATARNLGWPISARSLHELSVRRRITRRTFEEEQEQARSEADSIFKPKDEGDRNPQNNPDDNQRTAENGLGNE